MLLSIPVEFTNGGFVLVDSNSQGAKIEIFHFDRNYFHTLG